LRSEAVLLATLFAVSFAYLALGTASAQPTWSFWADISGGLYPGETHNVTAILRNVQCVERKEEIRFDYEHWPTLMNLRDEEVEEFRAKAEEGVSLGIFRSYSIFVNQTDWKWFGPKQILVNNITIVIRDYCVYKPIFVEKVRIWFPWKGYGRSLSSEVNVSRVLRGYEVSEFPLSILKAIGPREEGPWYDYYRNVSIPFWVPEDLPSEFLGSQGIVVEVDARTEGGVWTFGGAFGQPSVRVTGQVDVRPFRTFTLRVTDGEGAIPLGGAEVRLQAHVYPFSLKFTTNASGMVKVFRLPDQYTYSVRVLYRPPLLNESVPVLISDMDSLSIVRGIRAELHTMRIFPKDLKGRPLEGAEVVVSAISIHLAPGAKVNPLSNETAKGYAAFPLLPTGNYSYRVLWKGVEVCSGTRYLGYHPTYGMRPGSFEVTCRVGDLRIRAVDGMDNAIGAELSVLGRAASGDAVLVFLQKVEYAKNGTLVIRQVPPGVYTVEAVNRSAAFGKEVRGSAELELGPEIGAENEIVVRLPVFGIRIAVVSEDGDPLDAYRFEFGPIKAEFKGVAVVPGVPEGEYPVRVTYRGIEVFSGSVKVEGNVERTFRARVFRASFLLKDYDGEPVTASWKVTGPGGEFSGSSIRGATGPLPEAPHRLEVRGKVLGKEVVLLNTTFLPSQLRNATLTVPLLTPVFRVVWSDGYPFEGQLEIPELGLKAPVVEGKAKLDAKVLIGNYRVLVYDRSGARVHDERVGTAPGGSELRVRAVPLNVRVVDLLGQPIAGVSVQVRGAQGILMVDGKTDPSGQLSVARLPAAQAPFLVSAGWGGKRAEAISQGGELALRMDAVNLGGTAVDPMLVGAGIAIVIAIAAIMVFRRMRKRTSA
jgi:hypothetical protein